MIKKFIVLHMFRNGVLYEVIFIIFQLVNEKKGIFRLKNSQFKNLHFLEVHIFFIVYFIIAFFTDSHSWLLSEESPFLFTVICDEFEYMACDKEGVELLFNHLSLRTGTKSIIVTTNQSFDRWGEVIKD